MAGSTDTEIEPAGSRPRQVRKRARKACLLCRNRKVRCDVSQKGPPCTNCRVDTETCIVTGRASKRRQAQYQEHSGQHIGERRENDAATNDVEASNASLVPDRSRIGLDPNHSFTSPPHGSMVGSTRYREQNEGLNIIAVDDEQRKDSDVVDNSFHWMRSSNNIAKHGAHENVPRQPSDVVYCYYPFLSIGNLSNVPPQDVNFLEAQGCLRVPVRSLLDELLREYFLHIHPILPLIDEGDFWNAYGNDNDNENRSYHQVSLLLVQAMLFASCNFISTNAIKELGFCDIRSIKACFLRRTKLLYNLEAEISPLPVAQAAVLLSFTGLSSNRRPNIKWLTIAIENAKLAGAHVCATLPKSSLSQHQSLLKKVWWCCIIRDRSLGLLMRRPIQISEHHFDFSNRLYAVDLSDEYNHSRVYDSDTKMRLADTLALFIELCVILTPLLTLVFPLDETGGWPRDENMGIGGQIRGCKAALNQWFKSATAKLPNYTGDSATRLESLGGDHKTQHQSIVLYTNLMYMYYYTAVATICHFEALHLSVVLKSGEGSKVGAKDLQSMLKNQNDLQGAVSGLIACHTTINSLDLARYLPVSAIGCTALPLLLQVLDAKLFPSTDITMPMSKDSKKYQLKTLTEIMEAYQPQYDGVDWISEIVCHILSISRFDEKKRTKRNRHADCTDVFYSQPACYLRLTLALDVSLRRGRLAEDNDFPIILRGSIRVDYGRLRPLTNDMVSEDCNNDQHASEGSVVDELVTVDAFPTNAQSSTQDSNLVALGELEDGIYLHLATGAEHTGFSVSQSLDFETNIYNVLSQCGQNSFGVGRLEDLL